MNSGIDGADSLGDKINFAFKEFTETNNEFTKNEKLIMLKEVVSQGLMCPKALLKNDQSLHHLRAFSALPDEKNRASRSSLNYLSKV